MASDLPWSVVQLLRDALATFFHLGSSGKDYQEVLAKIIIVPLRTVLEIWRKGRSITFEWNRS